MHNVSSRTSNYTALHSADTHRHTHVCVFKAMSITSQSKSKLTKFLCQFKQPTDPVELRKKRQHADGADFENKKTNKYLAAFRTTCGRSKRCGHKSNHLNEADSCQPVLVLCSENEYWTMDILRMHIDASSVWQSKRIHGKNRRNCQKKNLNAFLKTKFYIQYGCKVNFAPPNRMTDEQYMIQISHEPLRWKTIF